MRLVPLALYWFLFFSGLGIFFPYFSLYLHENAGLDGAQVGLVLAVLPLVGIVAQPLWGYVADRTGARVAILVLITAGAAVGFAALAPVRSFAAIAAATALLSAFASGVVPVSLSVTFAALRGHGPRAFGLVRVWGTIGYLITVAGYPWLLHRFAPPAAGGGEPGLGSMFPATAACVAAAALVAAWLPRGGAAALHAAPGQWRVLLRDRALVRLLLFTMLGYFFLQGPTGLFPIFVRAHGGDIVTIGRMWVVMLLLEIPLVALSGTGMQRLGARGLLALGVLAGGLRWTICGLTDNLEAIYAAQLLHGVVVAGLLLGGPLYLELIVPERLRATAQGLLAMAGSGIGAIASNVVSGWLVDRAGPDAPYLAGGIGALLLGAAVGRILPPAAPRSGG